MDQIIQEVEGRLRQHPEYGSAILSIVPASEKDQRTGEVHINVVANLAEQEERRGLGEVLRNLAEEYRPNQDIHFHQYRPDNIQT